MGNTLIMNAQITLSLSPEIMQKATAAAQEHRISPADYLVRLLEKIMEEPLPNESASGQTKMLSKRDTKSLETESEKQKYRGSKQGPSPVEVIQQLSKGIIPTTEEEYAQRKHEHLTRKHGNR